MYTKTEKDAFSRLLDDPSETVQAELLAHFLKREEDAIAFLQEITGKAKHPQSKYAKAYLDRLGIDDTINTFHDFIRSFNYELETGSWLLDRTVNPKLDNTKYSEILDQMGIHTLDLLVEPCTDREKCRVLNRVIFHEYGFRGDQDEYKNPESSFISAVIERRKGIPLSLSIIYILVAMRCGIDLRPVGVPGRFMVGCFTEDRPFFIDVFEGGKFLSVADVLIFLETNRIKYDESALAPIPVGDVLCRTCRNLKNQYMAIEDHKNASLFEQFVNEFEDAYNQAHQA